MNKSVSDRYILNKLWGIKSIDVTSANTFSKVINVCFLNKTQRIQNQRIKIWSFVIIVIITILALKISGSYEAFLFIYLQRNESIVQRSIRASNLSRPSINALMSLLAFTDLGHKSCWVFSIPAVCERHHTASSLLSPIPLECALSLLGMF